MQKFLILMKTALPAAIACIMLFSSAFAQPKPIFRVIAFYTDTVESDHVDFAHDALKFYAGMAARNNFSFESTTDLNDLNDTFLKKYQLVIWLNLFADTKAQRAAFERYMDHGGSWLGFHVAAYNDRTTNWPWFVNFLGGGVFYRNSWPPLPAKLFVDDRTHPVTRGMPQTLYRL